MRMLAEGHDPWGWGDTRKERSVLSTGPERAILDMALEIFKYDPDWTTITLGEIVEKYYKEHPEAEMIKIKDDHYEYKPFRN